MNRTSANPRLASPAEQVQRCLESLAGPGDGVLVAVSGGSDSVALLAAAAASWPHVQAAHIHHGLRAGADDDVQAVTSLCSDLGVPLHTMVCPPAHGADRSETAARARRLEALADWATNQRLPWILTAHHLDDALETALLNLRRGHRGARALAGIPTLRPARNGGGPQGPRYLRPFLHGSAPLGRRDLWAWRCAQGLPAVHDETNDDLSIPRNGLRALLARDQLPLTGQRLAGLRRAALVVLQQQLGRAAESLTLHLAREGLGARLATAALEPASNHGRRVECLRLLGPCLAPAHRLDLRGTVLKRLAESMARGRGQLLLPAWPEPLLVECRPDGLHFPAVTVASGDPVARVLNGLWATPLFL